MENVTDKIWYYLALDSEEPLGPVSTEEIRFLLKIRKIHKDTLVWKDGMKEWEYLSLIPVFTKTEILKMHVLPQEIRIPEPRNRPPIH